MRFPPALRYRGTMDDANFSYRSLELLCHRQAKLSATPAARKELERMALEYKRLAERQETELGRPIETGHGRSGC
jgi:hypothetical protein